MAASGDLRDRVLADEHATADGSPLAAAAPAVAPQARQTDVVDVHLAGPEDVADLARLLWLFAAPEEQARRSLDAFASDLAGWCAAHRDSHTAFLGRLPGAGAVGLAWVALLPRAPRPGDMSRVSADLQSVFVLPEHRGHGIGTALVRAATKHAESRGASRVTVNSAPLAVPLYERLGFAASGLLLQLPAD